MEPPDDAKDITVDDDLSRMLLGASLCKIKSKTWKKQRLFKLQEDFLTIWYESKKSNKSKATFSVVEIEAVREGHQSEVLQSSAGEFPPERCFTIVFRGRRGNLDLVAESEEEAQRWVRGIAKLIRSAEGMGSQERLDAYPRWGGVMVKQTKEKD